MSDGLSAKIKEELMNMKKIPCYASCTGVLLFSLGTGVYGGAMGNDSLASVGSIYVGAFGGGGAVTNTGLSQQGTAFYAEASGGPLAVNATGQLSGSSAWIVGGHVGYQWPERVLNHIGSNWTFAPATELEGFYIGGASLSGDDLSNDTTRLTEHDFFITSPMQTGVFLVNAVFSANHPSLGKFHPYIGVGAGTAVISIVGANSTQKTPSEPGINHYNSGSSDTGIAFAAQPKMGVSFNLSQNTTMFVEYRFLYLSASNYTLGSTVYPTHVATSNWDVKMGSQYFNMGTVGLQYDL